jgi:SAM-dependent methyltransferase
MTLLRTADRLSRKAGYPIRVLLRRLYVLYLDCFHRGSFALGGTAYRCFYHHYNKTWRSERAVEIPIAREFIRKEAGAGRILEVGNVLNHYLPAFRHDVVDKYEVAPGVINADAADFKPPQKYDLVVSISTIEHVGWDEELRDPRKAARAYLNLVENCLAPGGRLLLTVPLGYHRQLDESIYAGRLPFTERRFLKRVARDRWTETDAGSVSQVRYGEPFPYANAIFVGTFRKPLS